MCANGGIRDNGPVAIDYYLGFSGSPDQIMPHDYSRGLTMWKHGNGPPTIRIAPVLNQTSFNTVRSDRLNF
jgi:hypothetical protein